MMNHYDFVSRNEAPLRDRYLFVSIDDIWEAKPIQYESKLIPLTRTHSIHIDSYNDTVNFAMNQSRNEGLLRLNETVTGGARLLFDT